MPALPFPIDLGVLGLLVLPMLGRIVTPLATSLGTALRTARLLRGTRSGKRPPQPR